MGNNEIKERNDKIVLLIDKYVSLLNQKAFWYKVVAIIGILSVIGYLLNNNNVARYIFLFIVSGYYIVSKKKEKKEKRGT